MSTAARVAFLFPGQGAQYPNMLRDLREDEPVVAETFAEADELLGDVEGARLSELVFVDPADEDAVAASEAALTDTRVTQPAVLTADVALLRLLAHHGVTPHLAIGHSLGEYGALVAAGAIGFADALRAVQVRARAMVEVPVEDPGAMAAVMAPLSRVQELVDETGAGLVVANVNSTKQAVIGGPAASVDLALEACAADGVRTARLPVSRAFHTRIVAPASEPLRETLRTLELTPPGIPVVSNVTGAFHPDDPAEIVELLARQVAEPVQFVAGLESLYDAGARVFVEVGPKRALRGFAADVLGDRDVAVVSTNHTRGTARDQFAKALEALSAAGIEARTS